MSIQSTMKVNRVVSYPDFGVTITDSEVDIPVIFEVAGLDSFDGTTVGALFKVTVDGVIGTTPYRHSFLYSGSGNPLDEAEPALKLFLGL